MFYYCNVSLKSRIISFYFTRWHFMRRPVVFEWDSWSNPYMIQTFNLASLHGFLHMTDPPNVVVVALYCTEETYHSMVSISGMLFRGTFHMRDHTGVSKLWDHTGVSKLCGPNLHSTFTYLFAALRLLMQHKRTVLGHLV